MSEKKTYEFSESVAVKIPKKAVIREITSKDGEEFLVIKLQGKKYRGYEFIYPAKYVHESKYDDDCLFTYMWPSRTVTINKRRLNEETKIFENTDSKTLSPMELREIFSVSHDKK